MREAQEANDPEKPRVPQVTFTGKLIQEPSYSRYEILGELVAIFPLEETDDRGKLIQHRVIATGRAVDQVDEGIKQGFLRKDHEVVVTGREVEPLGKQERAKFYATSVRKPQEQISNSERVGSQRWWEQEQIRMLARKIAESEGKE